jgi:N-terminal half of MaoC dehydratase
MAATFTLTDEMKSVIGKESAPYPAEYTSTGIRAFARGVGYTDKVYYDTDAAKAAGYANLPAPPCYLGVPVFLPGESDATYGAPRQGGASLQHGLKDILDGGTSITYARIPVAGETLYFTSQVSNLETKESKSLGIILLVSNRQTFRDSVGNVVFTVDAQAIWY